ncbi:MAG: carboxylating nicotinate-nucleotide diphosphorylase [Pirellulales bacterium]
MNKDFTQLAWDPRLEDDCRQLVRLAVREDLDRSWDWTTAILVPRTVQGAARVVARSAGVVAGLPAAACSLDEMQVDVRWTPEVEDGARVVPGQCVAQLAGTARDLLTSERIVLNFLGRLSGVASLTRRYADQLAGTSARLYDTRKTTPGWRRLEKYAVRCGGGHNHRLGLFDAILIKDNHLACGAQADPHSAVGFTPAEAVQRVRTHLREHGGTALQDAIVEVEVDSLEQLVQVLPAAPDIVLLDNLPPPQLIEAVRLRNQLAPQVELEASGGVTLETLSTIARTGVERISVGALTHSAVGFDFGLDWGG